MKKAGILALAAMVALAMPVRASDPMPMADFGTYTCAWFLADFEKLRAGSLASLDAMVPVLSTIGASVGYFQATADAKADTGVISNRSFMALTGEVVKTCQGHPNKLVIEVIRFIAEGMRPS